jgi:hypothetical protein
MTEFDFFPSMVLYFSSFPTNGNKLYRVGDDGDMEKIKGKVWLSWWAQATARYC